MKDKLFTGIYVFGSALSIASAMVLVIFLYVKLADIYPEHDRSEVYILDMSTSTHDHGASASNMYSLSFAEKLKQEIKSAEVYASRGYDDFVATGPAVQEPLTVVGRPVGPDWFRLHNFRFMEGGAFTQQQFDDNVQVAMISDNTAVSLFGSDKDIVGKTFTLGDKEYQVCGVYDEPSYLMRLTFAQVMFPYTNVSDYDYSWGPVEDLGPFGKLVIYFRLKPGYSAADLRAEIDEIFRRMDSTIDEDTTLTTDNAVSIVGRQMGVEGEFKLADIVRKYGIVLLMLLIVPALNLSGLIAGRMEARLPEMGVRKSFGATRSRLLRKVLIENLRLTSIGGAIGFALALLAVWASRHWIFTATTKTVIPDDVTVNLGPEILLALPVFAIAFAVCLLLNLLAAFVPVWWSLRRPIVNSLSMQK